MPLERATVLMQGMNYSGSGDWLDESGNSHDATPQAAPTFTTDHFVLNGTSQYLSISDHANLNFIDGADFTIMIVAMKVNAPGAWDRIFEKRGAGSGAGYAIMSSGVGPALHCEIEGPSGSAASDVPPGSPATGVKFSASIRRDDTANEFEAFTDGAGSGTPGASVADCTNVNDLMLGRTGDAASGYFDGNIYAFALWREALTDADVLEASVSLVAGWSPAVPSTRKVMPSPRYGITRMARR